MANAEVDLQNAAEECYVRGTAEMSIGNLTSLTVHCAVFIPRKSRGNWQRFDSRKHGNGVLKIPLWRTLKNHR